MRGRRRGGRTGEDYGLLVPAATAPDLRSARQVRSLLHAAGIRSTIGPALGAPGRMRVLVFPEDVVRAFAVLCGRIS
ncbi:hypothetical protein [Nocardia asteroides]|uniref:hypothetical protein n=1 Tax=Nocardia asteroides TaxID=1824 RepID=UPI003423BA77